MVKKINNYDREKYLRYLASSDWLIKKSKLVMTYLEMGWALQCNHCGSKYNLQCHHLSYSNLYKEKVEDLCFLCKDCHERSYSDKNNFNRECDEQFFEIINNPNWTECLVGLTKTNKNKKYGK